MKVIQSVKNPQVKQWRKLATRKERDKTGRYMMEGFHLVEEALSYKNEIEEIIMEENIVLPAKWNMDGIPITIVTAEVAKSLAETETTQGIFAVCKKRDSKNALEQGTTFLLIDRVQDPGNIGTMIRTADAAGIDAVVLGKGSADPYNPKVLRAAQGSHFHVDIVQSPLEVAISLIQKKGVPVYGTALQNAENYRDILPSKGFAVLVGNEGSGVSQELLSLTDHNVYVPIYGKSESLNVAVAAGILLYHFQDSTKGV
ncbi:TrmH family RNA methyltransferase [Bacillus smithii]|uniref:TrmH family RNA methyltransferase n=1 Tax=Bacillus smithii TaxID=1479 RepID=UPI003D2597C7